MGESALLGKARTALRSYFGFADFRPGQGEVIDGLLARRDCLAVMPTGAGKSLCYQVPALVLGGLTIVVSPLISLMADQVESLRSAGIRAAYLNSSQTSAEQGSVLRQAAAGELTLLYVAPERLAMPGFTQLAAHAAITQVAIDEAHCISQWGQDFRPSYLDIPRFIAGLPTRPVVGAFTATATEQVRADIAARLGLREPLEVTSGFDRPNLSFEVREVLGQPAKDRALLDFIAGHADASGIVYCSTRNAVDSVCALLCEQGYKATSYHAGLSEDARRTNQESFVYDRARVMVATNAFGMGIDKSNVSYVVHYNIPMNLESYYQEAGRAGRDGSPATCLLLYASRDVHTCEFLITHGADATPDAPTAADEAAQAARDGRETHDFALLRQMVHYATTTDCLRATILRYFGESAPPVCGNCSNCRTSFEELDATTDAQKVISCVYRLRERNRTLGKSTVAAILRGSRSAKVLQAGYATLSTYGIMASASAQHVGAVIDALVDRGYLTLTCGQYPMLEWNARTRELLAPGSSFTLKRPAEPLRPAAVQPGEKPAAGHARRSPAQTALSPEEYALFEALREERAAIAQREGVPAYIVFSDATLMDMCRRLPRDEAGFLEVNGVGQVKCERYAQAFLGCIRGHLAPEEGAAEPLA
jgi:ATP-dependent DNA helicase RecQ